MSNQYEKYEKASNSVRKTSEVKRGGVGRMGCLKRTKIPLRDTVLCISLLRPSFLLHAGPSSHPQQWFSVH